MTGTDWERCSAGLAELLEQEARFMRFLEKAGRLNRAIEFLPSEDEIAERKAASHVEYSTASSRPHSSTFIPGA